MSDLPMLLTVLVLCVFVYGANAVIDDRTDPFSQELYDNLLTQYNPAVVASYGWTPQTNVVFDQKSNYTIRYYKYGHYYSLIKQQSPEKTILMFSQRYEVNEEMVNSLIIQLIENNRLEESSNGTIIKKITPISQVQSNTEVDFDPATNNGSNGLYIYLVELEE